MHSIKFFLFALAIVQGPAWAQQTFFKQYGDANRDEGSHCLFQADDGSTYIGGDLDNDAMVMRMDPQGNILWVKTFAPGTQVWPYHVVHLTGTLDGDIIGCGYLESGSSPSDKDEGFHFRMDTSGTLIWSARWPAIDKTYSQRIAPIDTNTYLLVGCIFEVNSNSWSDIVTARIDAATGQAIWISDKIDQYGAIPYLDDVADMVRIDNAFYTTGRIFTNGSPVSTCRMYLSRFGSDGAHTWTKYLLYGNTENRRNYASCVIAANDSLVICGHGNTSGSTANYEPILIRLDTTGSVAWAYSFQLPLTLSEVTNSAVALADGYAISGTYYSGTDKAVFLIRVDLVGTLLWARAYSVPDEDHSLRFSYSHNLHAVDSGFVLTVASTDIMGDRDIVILRTDEDGLIDCFSHQDLQPVVTALPTSNFATSILTTPHTNVIQIQPTASLSQILGDQCLDIADILGPDTISCGPHVLDATVPGATYLWSDGSTSNTLLVPDSGTYWVQVEVGCCYATDTIHVDRGDPPVAAFTYVADSLDPFTIHLADQSTDATSYLWNFGTVTSTDPNVTHSFEQPGSFLVCLIVWNDCGSDTLCEVITLLPTDIDDPEMDLAPTVLFMSQHMVVALPWADQWSLRVYNSTGSLVHAHAERTDRMNTSLRHVAEGILLWEVSNERGHRWTGRGMSR